MSATDDLRRILDERGVEWMPSVWSAKDETFYKVGEIGYLATELSSGRMKVCIEGYPTPEQAVAATLGPCSDSCNCTNSERTETCYITDNGPWGYPYVCSACGASFDPDINNGEFNFCPNCGAKIVDPTINDVDAEVDG